MKLYIVATQLSILQEIKSNQIEYVDKSSMLVGYDCNNPTEIKTYSNDEVLDCNEDSDSHGVTTTEDTHFQILQKNSKVKITGGMCQVFKSTRNNFCGRYSHQTSITPLDVTHVKIKLDTKVCKKWLETLTVEASDMGEDTILEEDTPKMTLSHNGENIFRAFKRGSHIFTTANDVNCLGSTSLVKTGNNKEIEISQVVTHIEYKIKIQNVTLVANQQTGEVVDKTLDRRLDCLKQTEKCSFNMDNYIWKNPKQKCDLYHVQYASGQTLGTPDGKYFVSNETLIYLKIKERLRKCGRTLYKTDLNDIFLLRQYVHFHQNQTRIRQNLEPEDIIHAMDYTSRDLYIYNKLLDNMKSQLQIIHSKHCIDTRRIRNNLFSSFNNIQLSDSIQPMRLDARGTFILPLAEVIYTFQCEKKMVHPLKMRGEACYKNIPVSLQGKNEDVLFLQARNRLLLPLGVETECLLNFRTQYKLINDKYSIYTKDGLIKSSTEYSPLRTKEQLTIGSIEREDLSKASLYEYATIQKWSDLIAYSTKKQTLLHALSKEVDITRASRVGDKSLVDYFNTSTILFDFFKNSFKDFGSYSAAIVTTVALILLIYNFFAHLSGCRYLSHTTASDKITYFFSPTHYLLKSNNGAVYLDQTQETELRQILDVNKTSPNSNTRS